ncbi:MAG: 3-octaprenyl-4-hydroxybenzoate carboxy-lyase [Robiginitomaculum sp.]|nr:MAG: 3-octaprenyl-4-hydroxybenzoate carboxy-lyase [Robiginitomaculum sp.]
MKKIIIGISGASGAIYGVRMLKMLGGLKNVQTHLVVSPAGWMNIRHELDMDKPDIHALADHVHRDGDIGACIASGSYKVDGMVIAPCSVKTMASIANGICGTLIARAADVCLKERRRLVLMVRETPLHLGHIRNMALVTEIGAIVAPPVPAFYAKPQTIEDMVDQTNANILAGFGLDVQEHLNVWQGIKG